MTKELGTVPAIVHLIMIIESNFSRRQEQAEASSFDIVDKTSMPNTESGVKQMSFFIMLLFKFSHPGKGALSLLSQLYMRMRQGYFCPAVQD